MQDADHQFLKNLFAVVPIGQLAPDQIETLQDTPARWRKAMREMLSGYSLQLDDFSKKFPVPHKGMITLRDIEFTSVCEHHLLPFSGSATVAYLPEQYVIGLSKLARIVDMYSKRLQVQERMTDEIANAIRIATEGQAAFAYVESQHGCVKCRGVRKQNASMVTYSISGTYTDAHVDFFMSEARK
jgi:GTP cyclohydrolase I